jgi:hypothetical protein
MPTESEIKVARYQKVEKEPDGLGRVIGVRRLKPSEQTRVSPVLGARLAIRTCIQYTTFCPEPEVPRSKLQLRTDHSASKSAPDTAQPGPRQMRSPASAKPLRC